MPETSTRALRASINLRAAAQRILQDDPVTAQALIQIQNWIDTTEQRFRQLTQSSTAQRSPLALDIDGSAILDGTLKVDALIATVAWITNAMIVSLSADKLTAGTIDASVINVINLVADNIASGTLDAAIINVINLNAANINSGFLSADRIAAGALDVTKLVLRQFASGVLFQNHTPTSPAVQWAGTYAVYIEGTAYAISGGNTTNKYIWFEPAVSTTAFQTSNSFTAGVGKFLVAVNTAGVAEEAWFQIAAASITASMFSQGSVTGGASGAIAASTIQAVNVLANSITADRLVIGNFENLAEDPTFEANSSASWPTRFGNWAHSNDGNAKSGTYALKKTTAVADDEADNILFVPCMPDDTFYAEVWMKGTGNGTGAIRISFYQADKSTRTFTTSSTISATGVYALASVSATCPAGYVYARVSILGNSHTSGNWYADGVYFKRKSVASFIESLDADVINTGTLTVGGSASQNPQVEVQDFSNTQVAWMGLRQGSAKTITGATNASPIIITTSGGHGFGGGDKITIAGVTGNTAANGTWIITWVSGTQFGLNGSTGNGAYGGGGTAVGIYEGGWFKTIRIGGASEVSPKITSFNDGSILINGATFSLPLDGVTTTISNQTISGVPGIVGLRISHDSSGYYLALTESGWQIRNASNNRACWATRETLGGSPDHGALFLYDGSGSGGLDGFGSTIDLTGDTGATLPGQIKVLGIVVLENGTAGDKITIEPGTAATATAGGGALPAAPVGFLKINVGGTARRIPYYAV